MKKLKGSKRLSLSFVIGGRAFAFSEGSCSSVGEPRVARAIARAAGENADPDALLRSAQMIALARGEELSLVSIGGR